MSRQFSPAAEHQLVEDEAFAVGELIIVYCMAQGAVLDTDR